MRTSTQANPFDEERSEQFGNRLVDTLNQMGIALMLSVGHRTGLLEVMAGLPPSTSEGIARAAGCDERYVREWLACLATADVLDYAPGSQMFNLPQEHAVWFARDGVQHPSRDIFEPDELAETFASLMEVQPHVVNCFQHGGGVPYAAYGRFHELMTHNRQAHFDAVLLDSVLPLVPGWGKRMDDGVQVADFGCGSGHVLSLLAQAFPQSSFTGYDISPVDIDRAQADASRRGLVNVRFRQANVGGLVAEGIYDVALALDVIHDLAQPAAGLGAIARSLKPGGILLMMEFAASSSLANNLDHPLAPWLYAQSVMYCMTVSLSQGGAGLGCMWGKEQALAMLAEAGFVDVEVKHTEASPYSDYFVARISPGK